MLSNKCDTQLKAGKKKAGCVLKFSLLFADYGSVHWPLKSDRLGGGEGQ